MTLPLLALLASLSFNSPFCAGFEEGFAQGYCNGEATCLAPLAPLCPLPAPGRESYQEGFRRGMLAGMAQRG